MDIMDKTMRDMVAASLKAEQAKTNMRYLGDLCVFVAIILATVAISQRGWVRPNEAMVLLLGALATHIYLRNRSFKGASK